MKISEFFDFDIEVWITISIIATSILLFYVLKKKKLLSSKINIEKINNVNISNILKCNYVLVEEERDLINFTEEIINNKISKIGLDTEYHKGNKYQGHLCLFQISYYLNNNKKIFIVDLLKFNKNTIKLHLEKILNDENIEKIIHASENDCEWIFEDFGIFIKNIFDTQEVYSIISSSSKKVGLNILLNKYFQLNLEKETKKYFQTSNWNQRPLIKAQIDYAAMDTFYLVDLRDKIYQEVKEKFLTLNKKKKKRNLDEENFNKIEKGQGMKENISNILNENYINNKEYFIMKNIDKKNNKSEHESFIANAKIKLHDKLIRKLLISNKSQRNEERAMNYFNSNLVKCENLRAVHLRKIYNEVYKFNDKFACSLNFNPEQILSFKTIYRLTLDQPEKFEDFEKIINSDKNFSTNLIYKNDLESNLYQKFKKDLYSLIIELIQEENKIVNEGKIYQSSIIRVTNKNSGNEMNQEIDTNLEKSELESNSNEKNNIIKKNLNKKEKLEKIIKKFSCKKPVYENCRMLAPDGEMLCFCDNRKMNWYIERDLAELMNENPPIFRLKFEPNSRGCLDIGNVKSEFYVKDRKNCCVVCGYDKNYMRFYIIPVIYRQYLPHNLKSHKSHDVLLLCFSCHEKANKMYDLKKRELSIEYGVPLNSLSEQQLIFKMLQKVKRNSEIMKKNFNGLPIERKNILAQEIFDLINKIKHDDFYKDYIDKIFELNNIKRMPENLEMEHLTKDIIERISNYDIKNLFICDKKNLHGKLVVDQVKDNLEFIKSWREYFIEVMKPKFLPEAWNIYHQFERTFGDYSKFKGLK